MRQGTNQGGMRREASAHRAGGSAGRRKAGDGPTADSRQMREAKDTHRERDGLDAHTRNHPSDTKRRPNTHTAAASKWEMTTPAGHRVTRHPGKGHPTAPERTRWAPVGRATATATRPVPDARDFRGCAPAQRAQWRKRTTAPAQGAPRDGDPVTRRAAGSATFAGGADRRATMGAVA